MIGAFWGTTICGARWNCSSKQRSAHKPTRYLCALCVDTAAGVNATPASEVSRRKVSVSCRYRLTVASRVIRERGYRYDIILVDPLHEYGASMRDLTEALGLLTDRGTIVVHDCLPPTAELAGPNFSVGDWCGVTYQAYLDFVFARPNLEYRTVDIDYGCGVIRARSGLARVRGWWRMSRKRSALIAQWPALGHDSNKTFSFLQSHKTLLSNLRSLDDFFAEEGRSRALT